MKRCSRLATRSAPTAGSTNCGPRRGGRTEPTSRPKSRRIFAIQVPSTEGPDVALERSPRGLADAAWLDSMRRRHGDNSLWWRTHIDALFPDESHDALIPRDWVDSAYTPRPADAARRPDRGRARISCDLGKGVGGDCTVVIVRDNLGILALESGNHLGLAEAAVLIGEFRKTFNVADEYITFDAGGFGTEMRGHLESNGVKYAAGYSGSGSGGKEFTNLRTASAWALRRRLNPEGNPPFYIPPGPWWPVMREELLALRYEQVCDKTKLENKEDLGADLADPPTTPTPSSNRFADRRAVSATNW